jgi:hypothetical protein
MHEVERAHWKVVQALMPDARTVIGRRASKLLDDGKKFGIDIVWAHTKKPFLKMLGRRLEALR